MWPDSAHIQAQDAELTSRKRLRQGGKPIAPLYTPEDAQLALDYLEPHAFDTELSIADGLRIRYHRNGHILGAAAIEVSIRDRTIDRTILFSGDVGRTHEPILLDPKPPAAAGLVILESTYGDRDHRAHTDSLEELAQILVDAAEAGQNVIVPVFAVGRAQEILFYLGQLEQTGRHPRRKRHVRGWTRCPSLETQPLANWCPCDRGGISGTGSVIQVMLGRQSRGMVDLR